MIPMVYVILESRLPLYDFTCPFDRIRISFSLATPSLAPGWLSLYLPLSGTVWLLTFLTICLLPVVFKMLLQEEGRAVDRTLRMLLGQDLPGRLPAAPSYRILVAAWMVFSLVFGTAYRGNLTAALTLPTYPRRIETLSDLVAYVDRLTMPPYGADHRASYLASDSPMLRAIGQLMQVVHTTDEGLTGALRNREAHVDGRRYLEQAITHGFLSEGGKERLYLGKEIIFPSPAAFPVPHDAPYKTHFNHVIWMCVEAGLLDKWYQDTLTEAKKESRRKWREKRREEEAEGREIKGEKESGPAPLTHTHLQGFFLLFSLGLVLAVVSFLLEILHSYLHKRTSLSPPPP
ncbi:uncharacterized protein LOC123514904, partial [Portunus trituberculatus]